jgi:transposase InsO family protein
MRKQTTIEQRATFVLRHQAGETLAEIAKACGVSHGCVRKWWRRYQRGEGLQSRYRQQATGPLARFDPLIRYVLLRLRLAHPHWGPNRLRYHLRQRPSLRGLRIPSETQIGRYLHQWLRFRRQRQHRPPAKPRREAPSRVHQCWQVDFKLGIVLGDGTLVNLHTVHDPVGDVCITARVTPAGQVGEKPRRVRLAELQQTLRLGFVRWQTLPEEIQTDNEALFAGNVSEGFPSLFTLWAIGLGIHHHTIRPGKPTDNAEVERNHHTLNAYVIQGRQAATAAELQARLDQACDELAFALTSHAHTCAGRPPVVAHPELLRSPHPYQAPVEAALFDLNRVDRFLAQFTWQRKVTATGQVSLGGQHHYYSVGRAYANQAIFARFDPTDRHFIFSLTAEPWQTVARRPLRHLEAADILGFNPVPQQLPLELHFVKG